MLSNIFNIAVYIYGVVQFCPWCILYFTTEPQHKHVQNLEKATDLFQYK